MAITVSARVGMALCAAFALTACENGQMPGFLQATPAPAEQVGTAPGTVVEQDEEAPDVFQAAERGIWDGRPSLGGVWVAHPDVTEPQRVVIRNVANDKSTIGALFRRDAQAPGPRILVSSDAAATLGILAGQPTDLTVVALVRREIEVAPPPEGPADATPDAGADAGAAEGAAAGADSDADAAAIAAAALAATGAATDAATDAATETAADAATVADTAAPAAGAPRRGLFGFLRRGGASGAADPAAADPAADDPAAIAPAAVETQALDAPPAPEAASPAIERATAAAAPAAPDTAGAPARSFVQAAIFSVEANATEAAETLRAAGVAPDIRQSQNGERIIWRVLAGPAASRADLDALLTRVKALGFADAYFVRG